MWIKDTGRWWIIGCHNAASCTIGFPTAQETVALRRGGGGCKTERFYQVGRDPIWENRRADPLRTRLPLPVVIAHGHDAQSAQRSESVVERYFFVVGWF